MVSDNNVLLLSLRSFFCYILMTVQGTQQHLLVRDIYLKDSCIDCSGTLSRFQLVVGNS